MTFECPRLSDAIFQVPTGLQGMPHQGSNQGLVLSADAKPRLKWTRQLHELFVDAVSQLGGAERATPKSVMRIMGIPGLTLYHLKSHLQKFRLARCRDSNALHGNREQDSKPTNCFVIRKRMPGNEENDTHAERDEAVLKMQLEVQRKLQQQIEVQRHLQLRIEAQGKYLQSVLKKAQETLAEYSFNAIGAEAAKAELSELVSAVETESLSSCLSQGSFTATHAQHGECSTESCSASEVMLETKKDAKSHQPDSSSSTFNMSEESDEVKANNRKRNQNEVMRELRDANRSCHRSYGKGSAKQQALMWKEVADNSHPHMPEELDLNM